MGGLVLNVMGSNVPYTMQGVIVSFGESATMGAVYGRLAFFELFGGI